MSPSDYQRIREIFHGAWERPPGERTAFLDGACGSDGELRQQVESLLASGAGAGSFMLNSAQQLTDLYVPGTAATNSVPETIGPFRVVRLLGVGGMGAAYEAVQENPSRHVAIKTIRPGLSTPTMLRRFKHEAHILGRLRDPGIAQVYEVNVAESPNGPLPYIVMELLSGEPLDRWVQNHNPVRRERIELMAAVCDAVQHAHGKGIVHRDLKPGNVHVEPVQIGHERVWRPKVLDFGVARLISPGSDGTPMMTQVTDPGTLIGTLAYMSPEQVSGESLAVDARADVFALGVMLFELLTGRTPRQLADKSLAEAARIIRDEEPLKAAQLDQSLRGDLETICAKAMERDPTRRYQTAAELATDLRRHLGNEPIIARPATLGYQFRKFARRHRGFVAGLMVAIAAIVIGFASTVWYAVDADRQRDEALWQQAAAQWTTYKLSIVAADEAVLSNPARAISKLNEAPQRFRNWEWHHLMARLQREDIRLAGDSDVGSSVAFADDGVAMAAMVRGENIEVVDASTRQVLAMWPTNSRPRSVILSRDGRTAATRGAVGAPVRVYDTATGVCRFSMGFDQDEVPAIGLAPDGSLLGVVVLHKGLQVFDTMTAQQVRNFEFNCISARYGVVEFSSDLKRLVCSAIEQDGSEWLSMFELDGPAPPGGFEEADAARFSADGSTLATATITGIHLRDGVTLELRGTIYGQVRTAWALAFSGDGARLAGYVGNESAHIWSTATGELERSVPVPDQTKVLALDRDGDRLLAAAGGGVTLVRLSQRGTKILRGHSSYVYMVTSSNDGRWIASSGWDGNVIVWDAHSGEQRLILAAQPLNPLAPIHGLAFSRDSALVIVLTHQGDLIEYDVASILKDAATQGDVVSPVVVPLEKRPVPLANSDAADARYWADARPASKLVATAGGEMQCSSSDGRLLAVPQRDVIVIADRSNGTVLWRIQSGAGRVLATAFSPDGTRLATNGRDRSVCIWDLDTGQTVACLPDHEGDVYTLRYSSDGTRLFSGDANGMIFVWDTQRYEKVVELRGHTSYVHSLDFSPDGATLYSGSGDGTVRMWMAPTFVGQAHR